MTFGFFTAFTMIAVRRDLFPWKTREDFTFQIQRLRPGGIFRTFTFPWKPGMARRFFTFPIKRGGASTMLFTFSCAHEMEGWQWLRRGVTFPILTFQIKGWKRVAFGIFTF